MGREGGRGAYKRVNSRKKVGGGGGGIVREEEGRARARWGVQGLMYCTS